MRKRVRDWVDEYFAFVLLVLYAAMMFLVYVWVGVDP